MLALICAGTLVAGYPGRVLDGQIRTWPVDGTTRTGIVVVPARPEAIVFAFHGHGGNGRQAKRSFRIEESWPEAIVVYPDGLPTKTGRDPAGRRRGWQTRAGENQDRDLRFVDLVRAQLRREHGIGPDRTFAMGHSNGGRMTYLLWAERASEFAAFGPSASGNALLRLSPKPAIIVAGQRDEIVTYASQLRSILAVLRVNGSAATAVPPADDAPRETWLDGRVPTVAYVTPGGHRFEQGAVPRMVAFFRAVQ